MLFQVNNVVAQEKIKKKLIKVESKHPVTAEMHQKNDSIKKNYALANNSKNEDINQNTNIY
jgi:hypothetical protein